MFIKITRHLLISAATNLMKKEITIDGNNFHTLNEFYDEVENKLTKGLDWKIGRNLDAYNDVLRGGFGFHSYEEPLKIRWVNSENSKKTLGPKATVKYLEEILKRCHPSNARSVKKDIEKAKQGKGEMLFDLIVTITRQNTHVELVLE